MYCKRIIMSFAFVVVFAAVCANADVQTGKAQTLYVPAYSHVYSGDRALPFNLAVMLVIRNTDMKNSIKVSSVEYYDDHGKLAKKLLNKPVTLGPLASASYFIRESDTSAGIGANFIVRWKSETTVNVPIVESVMIGARSGQGISFIGSSQEISE